MARRKITPKRIVKLFKAKPALLVVPILCLVAVPAVVVAVTGSNLSKEKEVSAPVVKQEETKPAETKPEAVATTPTETPTAPQAKPTPTPAPTPPPATPEVKNPYQYGGAAWYAFNRRTEVGKPVGTTWVAENNWLYYAQKDGYVVDTTPEKWAIGVRPGGSTSLIAFVESLNADGTMTISCMNCYEGWNRKSEVVVPSNEVAAYKFIH